jgi:capsular exopolysaccharide synthesis family protein
VIPQDAGFPDPASNVPPARRETKPVAGRIEAARRMALIDHQAPAPPALSSSPDVSSYLQALRRRWVAATSLGLTLAILAGLAAWFLLSPKYIAFGRVQIAYEPPSLHETGNGGGRGDFLTFLKTQAQQIMSRKVIWSALKKDEVRRLNLESFGKDPVQFIEDDLKVEFQDNQELVTVSMSSHDPQVSLAIVQAVLDSYESDIVYAEAQQRRDTVMSLNKLYDKANGSLQQKKKNLDQKLGQMTKDAGITDPQFLQLHLTELQARIRDATNQLGSNRLELVKAQAELVSHEARIKALKDPKLNVSMVGQFLKADPEAQRITQQITRFEGIIDEYKNVPPPERPTAIEARKRIKKLRGELAKRKKEIEEDLVNSAGAFGANGREDLELVKVQKQNLVTALEHRGEELVTDLKLANEQLARVKITDPDVDRLREQIKNDEEIVVNLDKKRKWGEVELEAAPRIRKVQNAELQKKDMKKQILGTIVAPVLVLLAVCMTLAWTEVRHRRIRSAGEVSRGLGIRVVGAVPALPNLERHLIGPTGEPDLEGHPALESIDAIRTQLLRDADAEATRVVMVTSATTGEGKTTVASHLASSLARAGRKTLLIDGDLRAPSAHQLFELPMQPGFSEVLLAEVELTDAVQPTTLDSLSFMAAGQWDREVLQALARDGLEGIFEKLREEFDFVVIDSHPVLAATDSVLIGQRADAVILSVLREVSQMPRVYAASQRLTTLGIRVLGAVVNAADPEEALAATASARQVAHS